eukprot:g2388.t1
MFSNAKLVVDTGSSKCKMAFVSSDSSHHHHREICRNDNFVRDTVERGYIKDWDKAEALWTGGIKTLLRRDTKQWNGSSRSNGRNTTAAAAAKAAATLFDPIETFYPNLFRDSRGRGRRRRGRSGASFSSSSSPSTAAGVYVRDEGEDESTLGSGASPSTKSDEHASTKEHATTSAYGGDDDLRTNDVDDRDEDGYWSPASFPVLATESLFNSHRKRAKTASFFFDVLNTRAFYIQCTAPLSLYAGGMTSGCVLECGAGTTAAVPVFEGYQQLQYAKRVERGGIDLDRQVARALKEHGYAVDADKEDSATAISRRWGDTAETTTGTEDEDRDNEYWPMGDEDESGEFEANHDSGTVLSNGGGHDAARTSAFALDEKKSDEHNSSSKERKGSNESAASRRRFRGSGGLADHRLDMSVVRALKESECFVCDSSANFDSMIAGEGFGTRIGSAMKRVVLPDGTTVALEGSMCTGIPEKALFCENDETSVPALVNFASKGCCDLDGSVPRVVDVVMAGGTTLLRGFHVRLANELGRPYLKAKRNSASSLRIGYAGQGRRPVGATDSAKRTHAPQDAAFDGARLLASLSSFGVMWISKAEWDDEGDRVLYRKCA